MTMDVLMTEHYPNCLCPKAFSQTQNMLVLLQVFSSVRPKDNEPNRYKNLSKYMNTINFLSSSR